MSVTALLFSSLALQIPEGLPESFRREVLQACDPQNVEAAGLCLRNSMSAEDFEILSDRISARAFRGFIDCEIETAWRLGDEQSPMAREMKRLLGIHRPGLAAGMIITDVQVRSLNGRGFTFENVRGQLEEQFPPGEANTACNTHTTPSADGTSHAD